MKDTQALQRYDVVDDFIESISKFRDGQGLENPLEVRKGFIAQLAKLRTQCEALQLHPDEIEYLIYALVAGIDEAALSNGSEIAMVWMRGTVQFELYGTNIAGKEFYDRLNELLEKPEKFRYALYVAYRVLASGFTGMFFNNPEGREELIDKCARLLVRLHSDLVVHKEVVRGVVKRKSSPQIAGWMYAAGLLLFMFLSWGMNSWRLNRNVKQNIKISVEQHSQKSSLQKVEVK